MLDALLDGLKQHDRHALARLLSMAARGEIDESVLSNLSQPTTPGRVVAFTGPAGVGKSTLIGRLIEYLRSQTETVAVLACDPQSPISGGALLGDRFRMPSGPDEGVFIRSLSTVSGNGAIAQNLATLIRVLQSFGFANILIETVGAGQGDTAIREMADAVVVLLQPESGDEIQGEKAGLLEIADVIAIHKADLPGVERAEAELRQGLELSMDRQVPVLRVSGKTKAGVEPLWKTILEQTGKRRSESKKRKPLLRIAQEQLACRFAKAHASPELQQLNNDWNAGKISEEKALERLREIVK